MRDRLVELIKNTREHCNKANCGNCGLAKFGGFPDCKDKLLADYLLGNGVIVPPCKVGQTVYTNFAMQGWYYRDKDRPYSAKIVFMGLNNSEEMGGGLINVLFKKNGNMMQFNFSDIGKTVFLTKEEAISKLQASCEQVKGGENNV